jgi:hypothetical protein
MRGGATCCRGADEGEGLLATGVLMKGRGCLLLATGVLMKGKGCNEVLMRGGAACCRGIYTGVLAAGVYIWGACCRGGADWG